MWLGGKANNSAIKCHMRGHWVGCFASDKNCRCTLLLMLSTAGSYKRRGKKNQ